MFETNNFICVSISKMMNFNKSTHLLILFTFAIIFVVLYLYYTINDVKRMSNELKKVNADIQKITHDLQGLAGSFNNLNSSNNLLIQKQTQQLQPHTTTVIEVEKHTKNVPIINQIHSDDESSDDDDATSVNTEELKNIINDNVIEDDDENNEENVEELVVKSDSEGDLRKLKYEDLKDLCKQKGISSKGTKEQLIVKLKEL